MITTMGIQSISYKSSSSTNTHYLHYETMHDERKRSELFHLRLTLKHTKIDALFNNGSQANIIFEEIVKRLGLETKPHPKPYPLGWVCEDAKLQVSKQGKHGFGITSVLIDEVEVDVV